MLRTEPNFLPGFLVSYWYILTNLLSRTNLNLKLQTRNLNLRLSATFRPPILHNPEEIDKSRGRGQRLPARNFRGCKTPHLPTIFWRSHGLNSYQSVQID